MKTRRNLFNQLMRAHDVYGIMNNGANMTLDESEYHQQLIVNAYSMGYTFGEDDRPERMLKAFIASTTTFLAENKSSDLDEANAIILLDVAGNFKFAGFVTYNANENSDEPGNWEYRLTFNEDDITELENTKKLTKHYYTEAPFRIIYDRVAYDIGVQFQAERMMYDSALLIIDTVTALLDAVANPDETVDIDVPGYAKFSVAVEDGEKIFAATPDGAQKHIINSGEGGDINTEAE
jgi:hypothetical protein